ncbi:MAG: carotenoid 1,2-hydratase [bacterium]|nr:MAG: carotenoid 1,2-hydratase [bacterium]
MKRGPSIAACLAVALALAVLVSTPVLAQGDPESWRQAAGRRDWSFPADHGSHPEFQTEWWYYTGNLTTEEGRDLGYQLTFFRTGLTRSAALPGSRWSVRDLYLAHFALTDDATGRFHWKERASREGPDLAGAARGGLSVWLWDWKAAAVDGGFLLQARDDGMALDLTLTPLKPPALHGDGGLSAKGPRPGQASWYASMTDLATVGTVTLPGQGPVRVTGRSWFDHEFGSNQLDEEQEGWDWFGLHLSDGTELMVYLLRRTDGSLEPASSGTLVAADGSWEHLSLDQFQVRPTGRWKSPQSGGTYPSGWTIRVPKAGLALTVTPLVPDQELTTEVTGGITYWEGAVRLEGSSGGRAVTGAGYVELTGYAEGMGGKF